MPAARHQTAILIVEDDSELGSLLEAALAPLAQTVLARSWAEARAWLERRGFALILLDLYLPDADLTEPLESIRARAPDLPVILMSGNIDSSDIIIDQAARLGVNDVLLKPFRFEALVEKVRGYLKPAENLDQ